MKNISYRGFNSSALTFESEAEFTKGEPVGISTSGACAPAGSGDLFIGICVSVRDNLITAQMEGYVEVPYSSTAPNCGWGKLCADGNGGVKVSSEAAAPLYRIIEVDTVNKTVGFIL